MPQLSEILKPWCDGKCPVQLNYRNLIGSASLRLDDSRQATLPDESLEALRALCGVQNVQVAYT